MSLYPRVAPQLLSLHGARSGEEALPSRCVPSASVAQARKDWRMAGGGYSFGPFQVEGMNSLSSWARRSKLRKS